MEIRLKNLTKVFPGNKKKGILDTVAVNNLDITIPDGKLVGLLGPSGCGKSTTLYMISGLEEPTSGEIWLGDEEVTRLSPDKRGIGLVFQNYALYPHMTLYKNIAFPLTNLNVEEDKHYDKDVKDRKSGEIIHKAGDPVLDEKGNQVKTKRKLTEEEIDAIVRKTAAIVQIPEDYLGRKPAQLSGGQQQRVAIARALAKSPRVLLLDEPLSNLDARLRLQTREEIRRLQLRTGVTTVFVTHDQEEAMSISDEIVVMKLGVMQQRGAPQEVYNNPCNKFVANFLGTPPINFFAGRIEKGKLLIEDEEILDVSDKKLEDQKVVIGIRPEGFAVSNENKHCLHVKVNNIETLGRDISIIASHPASERPAVKVIIDADTKVGTGEIALTVKPHKCFIFNVETEERIG